MRYSNQIDGCHIWRGYPGIGYQSASRGEIYVDRSPRAGGSYTISREARWMIEERVLETISKVQGNSIYTANPRVTHPRLSRRSGNPEPFPTSKYVRKCRSGPHTTGLLG